MRSRPITRTAMVTASLLLMALPSVLAQPQRGEAACTALSKLQITGTALSDVKTQWYPAGSTPPPELYAPPLTVSLPAFCRLDATLDRRISALMSHDERQRLCNVLRQIASL